MTVESPPTRFRGTTSFSQKKNLKVDRKGGKWECGIIRGVSLNTRGEALGHELWCDEQFVRDVVTFTNNKNLGLKARFTHPGLSSDGVGTKLGKFFDAYYENGQAYADLHIQPAAYDTPNGNLADYVMSMAEDTPEDFGLSISFMYYEVKEENTDPSNVEEYDIPIMEELYACDVVDTPAANPNGLFKRGQDAAMEADSLLQYALGLSDSRPEQSLFNVDGDRAKQFLARFLANHGLSITKDEQMSEDTQTPEVTEPAAPTKDDFSNDLNRYVEAFGAENGVKWFTEDVPFEECQAKHIDELAAALSAERDQSANRIAELTAELAAANEKLSQVDTGEDKGPEFSGKDKEREPRGFAAIRVAGRKYDN